MTPTLNDLRSLWHILNAACFGGVLTEPAFSYGPADYKDPVFGVYYPSNWEGGPRIHIDNRCESMTMVMSTMAHEMIHQWQDLTSKPLHHGNDFRSKAAAIKRQTGLTC